MPENELNSTIALLESRLAEYERKASELRSAINLLYDEAGLPQKYTDVAAGGTAGGPALTQIKRDTFYGKKQMTAVREYLEMRRGQGNGPATPRARSSTRSRLAGTPSAQRPTTSRWSRCEPFCNDHGVSQTARHRHVRLVGLVPGREADQE